MAKLILDMSDKEILEEISKLVGRAVKKPTDKIGWITDNPSDYVHNGKVCKEDLYDLYRTGRFVEEYIATLALTSLRNRPKDLFSLIRKQKAGNKVLEYGCGTSTHGVACAQLGCEVHITDISPRMLEIAEARYKLRGLQVHPHLIKEDFPSLPRKYFDTVICTDVVEHVPDPIALLKHFIAWMKLNGTIHLHVSTFVNLKKGHLPQAIEQWKARGTKILQKRFNKLSQHNYRLIN